MIKIKWLWLIPLILSTGCATGLYTRDVVYGDYHGQRYFAFNNYAKGGYEGTFVDGHSGLTYHAYVFPDCMYGGRANLRLLIPVTNSTTVHVERTSAVPPSATPAYLRIRSVRNDGRQVEPVHPTMALQAVGETSDIACNGSEQDRFSSAYPTLISMNLTFGGRGSLLRIGQQVPREAIPSIAKHIGYSEYIRIHNPSMTNVPQVEPWVMRWSPDDHPYVVADSLAPMSLRLKRDALRAGYIVTVPLDIVTLPVMWPFYLVSYNLNWHE